MEIRVSQLLTVETFIVVSRRFQGFERSRTTMRTRARTIGRGREESIVANEGIVGV